MTSAQIAIMTTIILYLCLVIFTGVMIGKRSKKSAEGFYLGGRGMGPLVTAMSAEASDMSSYLLMGIPGLAYLSGVADASWTAIGLAIGTYLNFLLVARRLRRYSVELDAITIPSFISKRYGEKKPIIMGIASLIILVFFVPYVASGLAAIGKLFNSLFGWNYMLSVIVGAIVMGPATGAILGGVFGCISFWECFGKSQFGAVLLGINPFYTFLVCVPTRILAGWLCGVAFKGLNKLDKTNLWSFGAAGLIGALCNTVLFMTTLCLCFYNTEYIQGFVAALGSANAFLFVIAFVGVNGLVEGVVCLITGAAIAKAVMYSRGKLAARKTNA